MPPFSGKGLWVWYLSIEGASVVAQQAKAYGCDWVAVKAGDGASYWPQFDGCAVIKQLGLRLYSWSYAYGGPGEWQPVVKALDAGSEGHILDVEAEFASVPNAAAIAGEMVGKVKDFFPTAPIAYAPVPVVTNFPNLPYDDFHAMGLVACPQFYTGALGTGVEWPLERLMQLWAEHPWEHPPPALYPVLQAYGGQTVEKLRQEMRLCRQRYGGFSLWAWHTLTAEMWQAIGAV